MLGTEPPARTNEPTCAAAGRRLARPGQEVDEQLGSDLAGAEAFEQEGLTGSGVLQEEPLGVGQVVVVEHPHLRRGLCGLLISARRTPY
jgi:hypothetical protein